MIAPGIAIASVIAGDLVGIAIIGGLLFVPQILGYLAYRLWSRRRRSGARLLGIVVPPLSIALPMLALYLGVLLDPRGVTNPESSDYDPISPLIGILAGIHFGAAVVAHGVGSLLEPPVDDVRITPVSKARRPN